MLLSYIVGIHASLCTCTRQRQRQRRFDRLGLTINDDVLDDISINDDCLTDADSSSYEYSYYGKTRSSYRMRNRRGSQPHSSSAHHHNTLEATLSTKSNMFRRRITRNKSNQIEMKDIELSSPNINDLLSPEILIKIFSYMDDPREISLRVLPVCRLWYRLGNDAMLWKSLVFSLQSSSTYKVMMETVRLRCQFLRSITLKNFRSPDQMELMIDTLIKCCKSCLSEVRIFNCQLHSSNTLVNLGQTCSNIRTLCLVRCDSDYRKSTHYRASYMKDASFLTAFDNLTTLCLFRTLAPATLSFEDAQTIVKVGSGSIKKLLLDCDFYGRGIRFMISALSDSLEVLWLQGRNYNDAMCQDLSKCSRLRNLCLRHAQNITPIGLKALGRLAKMEKLLLFNTAKLSFPGLNCFFASNFECQFKQSLRYLNLSGGSVAQSYNIQESGFIVNDKKQILKEIIYSNCPNVQYVVIEKELVSILNLLVN